MSTEASVGTNGSSGYVSLRWCLWCLTWPGWATVPSGRREMRCWWQTALKTASIGRTCWSFACRWCLGWWLGIIVRWAMWSSQRRLAQSSMSTKLGRRKSSASWILTCYGAHISISPSARLSRVLPLCTTGFTSTWWRCFLCWWRSQW